MGTIAKITLVASVIGFSLFSNAEYRSSEIPTVTQLEVKSYLGLWHEISRIENSFQDQQSNKGRGPCRVTTAMYGGLPDSKISVTNTCYRDSNVPEIAKAKARVVKGSNNAKLKVNFTGRRLLEWLGIGDGDYWILALGPVDQNQLYSWVLVGGPTLKYGWVLSRNPEMSQIDLDHVLDIAQSIGYDRNLFKSFR